MRVNALRDVMRRKGIDAFVCPTTDPHCGEYVPAYWQSREWLTGFNGSAGTAVVTLDDARLWTDSRYYIAAAEQLANTPFTLMKASESDTPSIAQWLCGNIHCNNKTIVVGVDGWVWSYSELNEMQETLQSAGIELNEKFDPVSELWSERPTRPLDPIEIHPLKWAGETAVSKLGRLREKMQEAKCDVMIISSLDDIAWTLNIRSNDVHCTPLAVSYLVIYQEKVQLYVDERKVTDEVRAYLDEAGVQIDDYDAFNPEQLHVRCVMLSKANSNFSTVQLLSKEGVKIVDANPVAEMKAIKNEAELEGFRQAMIRDGIALTKFYRQLKTWAATGASDAFPADEPPTELTIDWLLSLCRAEQPGFCGLSFDTIAGYAEHGAIVHYEATAESSKVLERRGLLLLDSGAQYDCGTTDITRTIPLGPLTADERLDYTLVLKGHIALARQHFPEGIAGTQIDALARMHLWNAHCNYGHGTGHGVGSRLSVHEGPHQIRHTWKPYGLRPGMTVTNEPGIYREGQHGVRIENTMYVVEAGESQFGHFCQLAPLTLCPIDIEPIVLQLMTADEVEYLNAYHAYVYTQLAPYIKNQDDRRWLMQACQPIHSSITQKS